MGKSHFTPGPWQMNERPPSHEPDVISDNGMTVCGMYSGISDDGSEEKANAQLISASPEMYTAADTLLQYLCGYDDTCAAFSAMLNGMTESDRLAIRQAIHDLQEALRKAEGE